MRAEGPINDYKQLSHDQLWRLLHVLTQAGEGTSPHTATADQILLRELTAHQIELEIQNRELRDTQSALEQSRNGYLELYDFAPVALCTLDTKNVIGEVNLAATRLLRRPRERILGEPFLALVQFKNSFRFWA